MFTHNQFPHLKDYTTRKSNSKSTAQQQHRRRRQKKRQQRWTRWRVLIWQGFSEPIPIRLSRHSPPTVFLLHCVANSSFMFCIYILRTVFCAVIDVDRLVNDSYNDRWLCWEITRRHLPKIRLFYGISIFFCRWRSESDIECHEWSSAQY